MTMFGDLSVSQLIKELEMRNFPVWAEKKVLQARLRMLMELEGVNADEFMFDSPESTTNVIEGHTKPIPPRNADMTLILAAIGQISTQCKFLEECILSSSESFKGQNAVRSETQNEELSPTCETLNASLSSQPEASVQQQLQSLEKNVEELKSELIAPIQLQPRQDHFEAELQSVKKHMDELKSEVTELRRKTSDVVMYHKSDG